VVNWGRRRFGKKSPLEDVGSAGPVSPLDRAHYSQPVRPSPEPGSAHGTDTKERFVTGPIWTSGSLRGPCGKPSSFGHLQPNHLKKAIGALDRKLNSPKPRSRSKKASE